MKNFIRNFKYANQEMPKSTKIIYSVLGVVLILFLLERLVKNPMTLLMIAILIFSIILHEIAHGLVAYWNGDGTAKYYGRLTLNPIKHIDPLGMLLPIALILMGSSFIIGWAKPVPINYRNLKNGEFSVFQVSIAGVITNFLLAFLGATIIKFFPELYLGNELIYTSVNYLIKLNIVLGVFNLLPVPPLDGSKVIWSLGNDMIKELVEKLEQYGFLIIIGLSYTGILWQIIDPSVKVLIGVLNFYINIGG